MEIGIIGSGRIGSAAATRLVAAGHQVLLSNSRGPESLAVLEQSLGQSASAGTAEEAAVYGEATLVANPLRAVAELASERFGGRIVIDANNYYPQRDGQIAVLDRGETTSSEWVAERLPGSRVVKAFNTIIARRLEHDARPPGAPGRLALPVAADDEAAKQLVMGLVDDMGFDAIDAGDLHDGGRQQPGTPVYTEALDAEGVRRALAAA